ncbi:hypothetical protein FGE12_23145 [Aggregicoccus sp. 17bor-14]|uniref:hypothetical protein n=1 Tax=Myxococcaceae TaxID=31 RepID=UPI00129CB10E|nr:MULTISPECIES: hypothetical protein [Myxococcaceae]MBF5045320.1 hypothetical protein [Simulacricoccus sp. 17bor-14]MRI91062.1 hypothetical protein [Aggregicoccus sp. 17bor-14]
MRPLAALKLLAVLLLAPAGSALAGPLQTHFDPADTWSENFTFQVDLSDGGYLWAQMAFTNIGPGSGTGVCRVVVRRPGREAFTAQTRVSRKGWAYAPDDGKGVDRLVMDDGACEAYGGENPGLRVALDGQKVELRFAHAFVPVVPPGGEVTVPSGRTYRSEILQPFGDVDVLLEGPKVAKAPEQLKGGAYVDHNRSTAKPTELASRWVRFRALRASPHLIMLARETPEGALGHAYVWREGEQPQALEGMKIIRQGEGTATSWRADFTAAGQVSSTGLISRSAPVQELGILGSMLKPLLGSPVSYTHRALLQREGAAALPGLLEVSVQEN